MCSTTATKVEVDREAEVKQVMQIALNGDSPPDNRAVIQNSELVMALTTVIAQRESQRTQLTGCLLRGVTGFLGVTLSRTAFWTRFARPALTKSLETFIAGLMLLLYRTPVFRVFNTFIEILQVKNIFILDSTTIALPKRASSLFPGTGSNGSAALKMHTLFSILAGTFDYFSISTGSEHDINYFPQISVLIGSLVIFDLGYWDFDLLNTLNTSGVFFLSRVKEGCSVHITTAISSHLSKLQGEALQTVTAYYGKIVIFKCSYGVKSPKEYLTVGFWNAESNKYHFYVSNLPERFAGSLYSLYRVRWQIEILFKTLKTILCMKDLLSSNPRVILNFMLVNIGSFFMSQYVSRIFESQLTPEEREGITLQRTMIFFSHVAQQFATYVLTGAGYSVLQERATLFIKELFDVNYKTRPTSVMSAKKSLQACAQKMILGNSRSLKHSLATVPI